MISEAEFVAIKAFDRTLAKNTDGAQRIINRKNRELEAAARIIIQLRADLAASQVREASLRAQITHAALA